MILLKMFFVLIFFLTIASYQFVKNYWIFVNHDFFSGKIFSTSLLFPILIIKNKVFKYSYFVKRILLKISATENF